MELSTLKKYIQKNVVDFSELVLLNYHNIGLDETDAIILIKLHHLLDDHITFISPKLLSESLSISPQTTSKRLMNLIDRDFIKMELVQGSNGKDKESYNVDKVIEKILQLEFETNGGDNVHKTSEAELVELFEEEFKKPLSVLDIQTITKWLGEDHYTFDNIKEALFKAVKARKLSTKYVDGILLNQDKEEPKKYKKTNLMRDLHQLWEK